MPRDDHNGSRGVWEPSQYHWITGRDTHGGRAAGPAMAAEDDRDADDDAGEGLELAIERGETLAGFEDVCWPDIQGYLYTGLGTRPVVICMICQARELVIEGLQPRDEGADQEELVVLSCDHVVGGTCWNQWAASQEQYLKCPLCS